VRTLELAFFSVFEWDHRFIVLKPFKMFHKGNFARSSAFARQVLSTP